MKKDRKAWIRILEVFIAILLIMGTILIILQRSETSSNTDDLIYEKQRQILDLASKNDSIRQGILTNDNLVVEDFVSKLAPNSWNYSVSICNLNDICPNQKAIYDKQVYASEVVVTSSLIDYDPKKLRFFVWMN